MNTQAQEIGNSVNKGEQSVASQLQDAKSAARAPAAKGSVDAETLLVLLTETLRQNQQQNQQVLELIAQVANNQDQAAVFKMLREDFDKARGKKGKKSLFRSQKTVWEKAEEAAWDAGKIAVGASAAYAIVKVTELGVKALAGA